MHDLFAIHWNAEELDRLVTPLREAGWQVRTESEDGGRASKAILANPPDAVVIYLRRLPSHGRETAAYLRTKLAADQLPILFVDGEAEKVATVREQVPDARYLGQAKLLQTLEQLR